MEINEDTKRCDLVEIGRVGEASEFLLHGLAENALHGGEDGSYACEFRVEVARVRRACDLRDKRCGDSLVVDVVPIDVLEEGMRHDFLSIGWAGAKTHFGFASK